VVILSGFGFCALSEAIDEDDFVEHGVWLRFFWFVRWMRYKLARRGAVATHSRGDWMESAEGDPHSLWGQESAPLERRAADSGKESVRPKGGGFERGTLNADR
jgi:hypothetical protein